MFTLAGTAALVLAVTLWLVIRGSMKQFIEWLFPSLKGGQK